MTQWEYARLMERSASVRQGGHVATKFIAEFRSLDGADTLADLDRDDERTLDRLDGIGVEGWELVTALSDHTRDDKGGCGVLERSYLFKRVKG